MIQLASNYNSSVPQSTMSASSCSPPTAVRRISNMEGDIQARDVLCGRDKLSHSHEGNKRFLTIIKQNRETYQNASSREAKTRLSCQIVAMIRDCGGRFLKCNETTGEWEPQDDTVAREKVAHALRSCKDPNRPKVKRTRVVKKQEPTTRENVLFEQALKYQQRFFEEFLAQADDSDDSCSQQSGESSSSSSSSDEEDALNTPIELFSNDFEIDVESLNFIKAL